MKKSYKRFSLHIAMMITLIASIFIPTVYSSFVMSNDGNNITIDTPSAIIVAKRVKTDGATVDYYSVEKALYQASSGDSIYIIPGSNATMYDDCTIKSGVKLYLPYDITIDSFLDYEITLQVNDTYKYFDTSGDGSYAYSGRPIYRIAQPKNTLTISEGKELTIDSGAGLYVCARINGGNAGYYRNCFTSTTYSSIILKEGAKITNYGHIENGGFIIEENENNGSEVVNKSGSTYKSIFTVCEHHGGTTLTYMATKDLGFSGTIGSIFGDVKLKTAPFTNFYLNNCAANLVFNYGSSGSAVADLTASGKDNITTITVVGPSSNAMVQILNKYSRLELKVSYLDIDASATNVLMNVHFYGDGQLNMMSLQVEGINLKSKYFYFPIGYLYRIHLHKGEVGAKNNFNFSQNIKMKPGAKLYIDEGTKLNATTLCGFTNDDFIQGDSMTGFSQPTFDSNVDGIILNSNKNGVIAGMAEIILNGEINVNNISGKIKTTNEGAILVVNNSTSVTSTELVGRSTYKDYTSSTIIEHSYFNNIVESNTVLSNSSNAYVSIYESNSAFYCFSYASNFNKFVVNFNLNTTDDSAIIDRTQSLFYTRDETYSVGSLVVTPISSYYTFVGWYKSSSCLDNELVDLTNPVVFDKTRDITEITVFAKWVKTDFTISYVFTDLNYNKSMSNFVNENLNATTYQYGDDDIILVNPSINDSGYKFYRWIQYNTETKEYSEITSIKKGSHGDITICGIIDKKEPTIYLHFISDDGTTYEGIPELKSYTLESWKTNYKNDIQSFADNINIKGYVKDNGDKLYSDIDFKTETTVDTSNLNNDLDVYVKLSNKNNAIFNSRVSYTYNGEDVRTNNTIYYCSYTDLSSVAIVNVISKPIDCVTSKYRLEYSTVHFDFDNNAKITSITDFDKTKDFSFTVIYYYNIIVSRTQTKGTLKINGVSANDGDKFIILENDTVNVAVRGARATNVIAKFTVGEIEIKKVSGSMWNLVSDTKDSFNMPKCTVTASFS